jgi:glycosyltransferase involved in cell wall biosynthesis
VNDASTDHTVIEAERLGIKHIITHAQNKGYGGNQKSCYNKALELNADIVVMLHPDYQYTPKLILAMSSIIANDLYPVVFGSRILGKGALNGGMPLYKYFFNRVLTFAQNILMGQKLSEYHSGYRAFKSAAILKTNYLNNSDDFVFDNQILAQIIYNGYEIAEITCPTRYEKDSSSINFSRSIKYGLGCMQTALLFLVAKRKIYISTLFK